MKEHRPCCPVCGEWLKKTYANHDTAAPLKLVGIYYCTNCRKLYRWVEEAPTPIIKMQYGGKNKWVET